MILIGIAVKNDKSLFLYRYQTIKLTNNIGYKTSFKCSKILSLTGAITATIGLEKTL